MPIDIKHARELLQQLDFKRLFIEELNWSNPQRPKVVIQHNDHKYHLTPQAEAGGLVLFTVDKCPGDGLPDRSTRLAIHNKLLEQAQEHLLVFVNEPKQATLWMWVEREGGKRKAIYEHRYHVQQPGDSLLQKLEGLAFSWEDLDEDGRASIIQVTDRVRATLATERVTKRFYDDFKKQHGVFLKFIKGIEAIRDREWYASIMLNRLMFIYFIQKKGFLNGEADYLKSRLQYCRANDIPYYRDFLTTLFFKGFACRPDERTDEERQLLGDVPYLNGGLFLKHQLEEANDGIEIPDHAFEVIFLFFDCYHWHLDDRPLRADNEINPDVLGYIFEKYINQKQMGAYYTKEDITEYITKNTVLPFLFDRLKSFCHEAVVPLPVGDIEPYIHEAMRKGMDLDLPPNIAAGLDDVSQRGHWNRRAEEDFALPTETWREHIARRKRVQQILDDFAAGKITTINDFITYNLDIITFTKDFISDTQDPLVVRAFYFECLKTLTVLDPTCGSGAFLFAALNLLESLYELCLQRMEEFLARTQRHPQWGQPFEQELGRLAQHPSRAYFIYKTIIVNNLYGVDIMEEAVEICKLRLFLKLVAQVQDVAQIEPLPDIDFNIRAGNTLVGYASLAEIEQAKAGKLDFGDITDRVKAVDRSITTFRRLQTEEGISAQCFREAKENLLRDLRALEAELNTDLAFEYGVTQDEDLPKFVESHKPFHWYVQFYDIMTHGGFDVIIGNPPYVEKKTIGDDYVVRGYATDTTNNLFAYVSERSRHLLRKSGRFGFIVLLSALATDKFESLQVLVREQDLVWASHFDDRPSRLFDGLEHCQQTIVLYRVPEKTAERRLFSTRCMKWSADERDRLFDLVQYVETTPGYMDGSIQKVGSGTEDAVLTKLWGVDSGLGDHSTEDGRHVVYYTRKVHAFLNILDFVPEIRDAKGRRRDPSEQKTVEFAAADAAAAALCALNSTLFRWYLTTFSDCRNVNRREVLSFPVDLARLVTGSGPRLRALAKRLSTSLKRTSEMREMRFGGQTMTVQCIIPKHSKPIIDEIDRVLAAHYGFTDEELDFIINYDIKYRVGVEEGEGGER